jgi:two-component system response regulator FixJ
MSDREQTVFVVDDDEEVRDSLTLLLESVGLKADGFGSAREFLDAYDPNRSGCLILDIRMPGMSGIELQQRLNDKRAIVPVIVITGHGDVSLAVKAMKGGAIDFLQKPFDQQELLDRVHQALADDAERWQQLDERQAVVDRLATLTPRERQVMELIVAGQTNKNVASAFGVSQRTVEVHRARVMEKTEASSLAHLVRMSLLARD